MSEINDSLVVLMQKIIFEDEIVSSFKGKADLYQPHFTQGSCSILQNDQNRGQQYNKGIFLASSSSTIIRKVMEWINSNISKNTWKTNLYETGTNGSTNRYPMSIFLPARVRITFQNLTVNHEVLMFQKPWVQCGMLV